MTVARLRTEMSIAAQFGNLDAAKEGLTKVLALLDDLSTPAPPPDEPPTKKGRKS